MAAATTDLFTKVGLPGSATTLESPGFTIGGTTLNVASTANWQNETLQVFAMDQVTIEAGQEVRIAGSYRECVGIVTSATSIGSFAFASGFSPRNYPAGSTTRVYIPVSSSRENMLVDGLKQEHNLNGTHKNITTNTMTATGNVSAGGSVTASSFIVSGSQTTAGWLPLGIAQSGTIVHNGNRSCDIPFASSAAAILSPGMRLLLDKTVAGNAYMGGAFNGSSHYFTKTSPTGALGTVTNNFTLMAEVMPTSYASGGTICGRSDSTPNNGLQLVMGSSGQVSVTVWNGGVANTRTITTYQSLLLNKKTHVAASWNGTGPAITIYFDGVAVSTYQSAVGGTNPTTAGTGGDWSIGRCGAYVGSYFPGYISNVAVFDAVLSAATIRQYATYKLTGSEPNCIGAWSLDNTVVNQQLPGTNDLAVGGGVGFTAMSPHGQLGDGVQASKAIGLVMAVNGSTATVQCPEGVTIPTTGGITSVSYATSGNPFGWVGDEGRWMIQLIHKTQINTGTVGANVITNLGGLNLNIPVGAYREVGFDFGLQVTHAGTTFLNQVVALSTSNSSMVDKELQQYGPALSANLTEVDQRFSRRKLMTFSALTSLYMLTSSTNANTTQYFTGSDPFGANRIWAIPAGV